MIRPFVLLIACLFLTVLAPLSTQAQVKLSTAAIPDNTDTVASWTQTDIDQFSPYTSWEHRVTVQQWGVTPYIYALLSRAVYEPGGGQPPASWSILTTTDEYELSLDGYFAAAYVNQQGQMVIAQRGTDGLDDIGNNFLISLEAVPAQVLYAGIFIDECLEEYIARFPQQDPKMATTFTGHSLGAVIAEVVAHEFQLPAVTFDSPGSRQIIIDKTVNGKPLVPNNSLVTTYQSGPNYINRVNAHVGTIHRIFVPYELSSTENTSLAILQQHSIDNIVAQFNPQTQQPYVEAVLGQVQEKGFVHHTSLSLSGIEPDFDQHPAAWWDIQYAAIPPQQRSGAIGTANGGIQTQLDDIRAAGKRIVGDDTENYIWGNTMNADVLLGNRGADRIDSHGGDDVMDGGLDGVGDTFRIVSVPNARGVRTIKHPEPPDSLEWELAGDNGQWSMFVIEGLATQGSNGGYRLQIDDGFGLNITFRLVAEAAGLAVHPVGNERHKVYIEGWKEGDLNIYLDPDSLENLDGPVNRIKGGLVTSGAEELAGGNGPDIVSADPEQPPSVPGYPFDDIIHTYGGNDYICADSEYASIASRCGEFSRTNGRNKIDSGAGNDRVHGVLSAANNVNLGSGDDLYVGFMGNDMVFGGDGKDIIQDAKYSDGQGGNDIITLRPNSVAYGGAGNDQFFAREFGRTCKTPVGIITMHGGTGNDIYEVDGCHTAIILDHYGINEYRISRKADGTNSIILRSTGGQDLNASSQIKILGSNGFTYKTLLPGEPGYTFIYQEDGSLLIQQAAVALALGTTVQGTSALIIENFYDGMLGIKGIAGAPTLPTSPWNSGQNPETPGRHKAFLPAVVK